jgi:hypothetical protein
VGRRPFSPQAVEATEVALIVARPASGACDNLTKVFVMPITRLSTKGQLILRKDIGTSRLLRPASRFPATTIEREVVRRRDRGRY